MTINLTRGEMRAIIADLCDLSQHEIASGSGNNHIIRMRLRAINKLRRSLGLKIKKK